MDTSKITISRIRIVEIIFFLAYLIYLVTAYLHISFYASYIIDYGKKIMLICAALVIYMELLVDKLNIREIIGMTICIILSFIIFMHTNGYLMFPTFIMIYGSRRIKFEKIAKFSLIVGILMFVFILVSAKCGIILDYVSYINGRERHFMGFRYALYPSMLMFNLTALTLYLDKKNTIKTMLLLFVLNYVLYRYTNSRLAFFLSIFCIIISAFVKKNNHLIDKLKNVMNLLTFSYIICASISLLLIFAYDANNSFINELDVKLEHRISQGKSSINQYPINLFGHRVEYVGAGLNENGIRSNKPYKYVDCLYLNIIEKYGVIYFIIYMSFVTHSLVKLKREKQYILFWILCMYAIMGMIDDLSIYLYYNTFLFVIGNSIIPQKIKEE